MKFRSLGPLAVSLMLAAGATACGSPDGQETGSQALTHPDRLLHEERLYAANNDSLTSPNGDVRLVMGQNCSLDLVEVTPPRTLWTSRTGGRGQHCYAVFQSDGNFVIYNEPPGGGRQILWSPNIHRRGGTHLVLQDDGELVAYAGGNRIWGTGTRAWMDPPMLSHGSRDRLLPGEGLWGPMDDAITTGRFRVVMQSDCNLVLYDFDQIFQSEVLWESNTDRQGKRCYAVMQTDGNFVVYSHPEGWPKPQAVWSSRTHGNPGAHVVIQSDGNLVVYQGTRALWASGTHGRASRANCRWDRTDTSCNFGVMTCKDVYVCPVAGSLRTEEQSSGRYACGVCVGGKF